MDIPHVLYNTIGTTFEELLTPEELVKMGAVSSTTRAGIEGVNIRRALDFLQDKLNKLYLYPIRTLSAWSNLAPKYILMALGIIARKGLMGSYTETLIKAELGIQLQDFNNVLNDLNNLCSYHEALVEEYGFEADTKLKQDAITMNYDIELIDLADSYVYSLDSIYHHVLKDISKRLNPEFTDYLYQVGLNQGFPSLYSDPYPLIYPLTPELRGVFIKYNQAYLNSLNLNNQDAYALIVPDIFMDFMKTALLCNDLGYFYDYLRQYFSFNVPWLQTLFERYKYTSLNSAEQEADMLQFHSSLKALS